MFNTAKRGAVLIAKNYKLLICMADLLAREGRLIRIPWNVKGSYILQCPKKYVVLFTLNFFQVESKLPLMLACEHFVLCRAPSFLIRLAVEKERQARRSLTSMASLQPWLMRLWIHILNKYTVWETCDRSKKLPAADRFPTLWCSAIWKPFPAWWLMTVTLS